MRTGRYVALRITIYRPFLSGRGPRIFCSYKVKMDGVPALVGSGVGMEPIAALCSALVMVSAKLRELEATHDVTRVGHELWWVDELLRR